MFSSRMRRRLLWHHLPVMVGCAVSLAALLFVLHDKKSMMFRWSLATAYVGLTLLAATLAIGPIVVLRGRTHPVSSDLRRDLGIWAGLIALAHFVFGVQVHMKHRYEYWFRADPDSHHLVPLLNLFGFGNYTGLAAVLIVALLLALSNDRSLRALGARRWKALQRWNYWLAALVIVHGIAYEIVEHRTIIVVLAGLVVTIVAGVLQFLGWNKQRFGRS